MSLNNERPGRNHHANSTAKRSILRALRLFYLQGWTWYRGNLINNADRLAAFFPACDINYVRETNCKLVGIGGLNVIHIFTCEVKMAWCACSGLAAELLSPLAPTPWQHL